ncbi:MAG: hypothetical protein MI725_01245 [Pirellulales bacterium]|nr:hypothetical protein [Pirellulales bacterium]
MFHKISPLITLFGVLTLIMLTGCSDSSAVSPEVLSQQRTRLLLTEEPDGVAQVVEIREALLGADVDEAHEHDHEADHEDHEHAHDDHDHGDHEHGDHEHEVVQVSLPTESIEIVVMGQIGGLANPWEGTQPDFPFAKNEAKFFLADAGEVAEAAESGHSHAPGEECAFCAAHAKDNSEVLAVVRFVDEKGDVLPMDARQLFDLKEKDTVVVCGTSRVIAGGILVVDATGLYIRR